MNPVEEVIDAKEVLGDWLGDGGRPAYQILAELRSQFCAFGNDGERCPCNVEPNWWDRFKTIVALWIRAGLELKNNMKLRVEAEDHINMCSKCGCCLRLKVWVPTKHLKETIEPQKFASAPDYCWLKKELTT